MDQLNGSFRLFRVAGINVFVHWSWFLVAYLLYQYQAEEFTSPAWFLIVYVSTFAIVLMHEFGHALACRQVGGIAERIILWPLGGIAYVSPPPRPGAVLWSIVAGPLVNVMLIPPTLGLAIVSSRLGWDAHFGDFDKYLWMVARINAVLLIFNLIPIYPLDGGQILQSLLWFIVGRPRSLAIVGWLGLIGGLGFLVLAVMVRDWLFGVMAVFITMRAWSGINYARVLQDRLNAPRHENLHCPSCAEAPPLGDYWRCQQCDAPFDMVQSRAVCPRCGIHFDQIACPNCFEHHPVEEWQKHSMPAEQPPSHVP